MITGLDHIALPMQSVDAMLKFYAELGCKIVEERPNYIHSVIFGDNKINFHTPAAWQAEQFSLRGHKALPGCGDICLVWGDSYPALEQLLNRLSASIEEGPVERLGGRFGSTVKGTSIYTRDPDANLLEFIIYK